MMLSTTLPWEYFFGDRGVIDEHGHDHGILLQVVQRNRVKKIEIRMTTGSADSGL